MANSKINTLKKTPLSISMYALFILALLSNGCKKNDTTTTTTTSTPPSYHQVSLVADTAGLGASKIDTSLANAWGIAIGPTGNLWISSNHKGLTTIYDRNGATQLAPVGIPLPGNKPGGSPTGVIYNNTTGFMVSGTPAKFIYATEDGTLAAWTSGSNAVIVADNSSSNAVYKGIAMANDGTGNFLYATNFKMNKIDVFDQSFNNVNGKAFTDPSIPAGFAPFNIQNIDGRLYISYAKQKPDHHDDLKGAGNGYIDIFNPDGSFVKRFASQGPLNSPWGLTKAPDGFGQVSGAILVGNFGDGKINVYDGNGNYKNQINDNGTPITIDGLWAIAFPQNNLPSGDQNQLFFTAGPREENHGLFGYISKR